MIKFQVKLLDPCQVAEAVHQAFSIHLGDKHVASGVNVELNGQRFIRIFDYDVPLKAQLDEYFSSRKRVNEVSFSRPYSG